MIFSSRDPQFVVKLVPETPIFDSAMTQSLSVNKACGHDNITAKLIRDAAEFIAKPLSYISNVSFLTGKVPSLLKIAKVIPIYKKGDRDDPSNYRPISILSIFAKILEKLVNSRLLEFLEVNDVFYKHQYGFRKKYSTKLSLINLINDVIRSMDKGKVTVHVGVFIDSKKSV